jgi:hypothetical protein
VNEKTIDEFGGWAMLHAAPFLRDEIFDMIMSVRSIQVDLQDAD